MADNYLNYIPPNLRTPARVGYQLLDNIIGFDDDYDTTGELLGRSLRENPVGTVSDIASSVKDGLVAAYEDPRGTIAAMGDEFVTAFDLLNQPVAEDASREELGQQLEAVNLLATVVPGYKGVQAGTRAVASGVDAGLQKGANRFVGEIGLPAPDVPPGSRMIVPTAEEYDVMSPEMKERMFTLPIKDVYGREIAQRPVYPMGEEAREALRPGGDDALELTFEDLGPRTLGRAYANEIAINSKLPKELSDITLQHELAHYDLGPYGSNLPFQEVGANEGRMAIERNELLERAGTIVGTGTDTDTGVQIPAELATRLEEIMGEALPSSVPAGVTKEDVAAAASRVEGLTPYEMYQLNPGEMLARLAQGDAVTAKRMSALAALNPKINMNRSFPSRALDSLMTAFGRDEYYANVPMDLSKSQVFDVDYGSPYAADVPPVYAPGKGDDTPF